MLFNSFDFAIFLLIVLALYYSLEHRWQNRMLLVAAFELPVDGAIVDE